MMIVSVDTKLFKQVNILYPNEFITLTTECKMARNCSYTQILTIHINKKLSDTKHELNVNKKMS